jgi:hypothetical protein
LLREEYIKMYRMVFAGLLKKRTVPHLVITSYYIQSDGKIVAPCQSEFDPDFVAYIAWVNAGNQPVIIESDYQGAVDA